MVARAQLVFKIFVLLLASAVVPVLSTTDEKCPKGTFNKFDGEVPCTKCNPGSYQNRVGQKHCKLAQPGFFAPGFGETHQTKCPKGTFSKKGASSCKPKQSPSPSPSPRPRRKHRHKHKHKHKHKHEEEEEEEEEKKKKKKKPEEEEEEKKKKKKKKPEEEEEEEEEEESKPGPDPKKREWKRWGDEYHQTHRANRCHHGHKYCPVYGVLTYNDAAFDGGFVRGYECVDVANDLESCGGCVGSDSPFGEVSQDGGRDCTAIPHVDNVRCYRGICEIAKCKHGFIKSQDGFDCSPII